MTIESTHCPVSTDCVKIFQVKENMVGIKYWYENMLALKISDFKLMHIISLKCWYLNDTGNNYLDKKKQ